MKKIAIGSVLFMALASMDVNAQSFVHYVTTEKSEWKTETFLLSDKPVGAVVATVNATTRGVPFQAWGTTFNELDLDAYNLLTTEEQEKLMSDLYSPDGDLRFTHGRVSMNANDYARAWYSCSEVPGDFQLRYFSIEHDKQNIIKLAKAAQKYYPQLQLFMSPWSLYTLSRLSVDSRGYDPL